MYIIPQPHKCIKCGFEFKFSPHDTHPAPVVEGKPVCPECWREFLIAHVGLGYCTVEWSPEGSDYDKMRKHYDLNSKQT